MTTQEPDIRYTGHLDDVLGEATFAGDYVEWDKPDGAYEVLVVDLVTETGPNKFKGGQLDTRLLFHFIPAGYTGTGSFRWWTSMSLHPKSKLPETCVALGVSLPTPQAPRIVRGEFLNRRCMALIEQKPSTTSPGRTYPRITRLFAKS